MSINIVQNDDNTFSLYDSIGELVQFGRGTADADITYMRLFNANGDDLYIYPNGTPDGLSFGTTKP